MAGTCEYGNEPSGSVKCGQFRDWLSVSRRILLHGVSKYEISKSIHFNIEF